MQSILGNVLCALEKDAWYSDFWVKISACVNEVKFVNGIAVSPIPFTDFSLFYQLLREMFLNLQL